MGRRYGVSDGGRGRDRQACQVACTSLAADKATTSTTSTRGSSPDGQYVSDAVSTSPKPSHQGQVEASIQREARLFDWLFWPLAAYVLIGTSPEVSAALTADLKHALDLLAIATAAIGMMLVTAALIRHWGRP